LIELLKEFKDVFSWTYKDLKGIPPKIAQHRIELNTTVPRVHQARYRLNPNYVAIVKKDIDKLLTIGFIKLVEEVTWLSSIMVVPQKEWETKNLWISKSSTWQLPFTNEVINTFVRHEV